MDYILSDLKNHFSYSYMTSSGYIAISIMVIFCLLVVLLIPGRKFSDRLLLTIFFGFMFGVYSLTILMRSYRVVYRSIILQPFYWYTTLKQAGDPKRAWLAFENLLMLMFPAFILGIILRNLKTVKRVLLITFIMGAFSLTIEYTQLWFNIGVFEIDDFLCNTFGALIGALIAVCFTKLPFFKKELKGPA